MVMIFTLILSQSPSFTFGQNKFVLESLYHNFTQFSEIYQGERIYLHVDKTLYQPGETIWFRAYLLQNSDMNNSELSDLFHVELKDEQGTIIKSLKMLNNPSGMAGDIALEPSLPNGRYFIEAYTKWQLNEKDAEPFRKEIVVRQMVKPAFYFSHTPDKELYFPGDLYKTKIRIYDSLRNPVKITGGFAELKMDNEIIKTIGITPQSENEASIKFGLPPGLSGMQLTLDVSVHHKEGVESVPLRIPFTGASLSIRFFLKVEIL